MKSLLVLPLLATLAATAIWPVVGQSAPAPSSPRPDAEEPSAERGAYLVRAMACWDCHTPLVMGPDGPLPDPERTLSGHPESLVMPPAPALPPGPWVTLVSGTNTAWSGPWGTSFTANLTPDPETGLGSWTEETFLATVRTGRHMGRGRELLPPMPVQALDGLSDPDLRSIFRYLSTLPPVRNRVPEPLPPAAAPR